MKKIANQMPISSKQETNNNPNRMHDNKRPAATQARSALVRQRAKKRTGEKANQRTQSPHHRHELYRDTDLLQNRRHICGLGRIADLNAEHHKTQHHELTSRLLSLDVLEVLRIRSARVDLVHLAHYERYVLVFDVV
jgi:hypothetical protein